MYVQIISKLHFITGTLLNANKFHQFQLVHFIFYDNGQLTLLVLVGLFLKLRIEMLLQINSRRIFFAVRQN